MKPELSAAIARLTAQTIAAGQEPYRSAAKLAHGLPVYADIGGTTLITPDDPQRPRGAVTCDACAGTGVFIGLPCGHCGSVGWIDA